MNIHELRITLAKMLPDKIALFDDLSSKPVRFGWLMNNKPLNEDGWLQVCHFIEQTLTPKEQELYYAELFNISAKQYTEIFADWVTKGKALVKIKKMKVV